MLATQSALRLESNAMAPGNQPTGINPSSFELPGRNETTPTAFCVPLQTKRVLPDLSNARALGLAPNKSAGPNFTRMVSRAWSVRVSITVSEIGRASCRERGWVGGVGGG